MKGNGSSLQLLFNSSKISFQIAVHAHFVGSSFQSFKTRSPRVQKLFCLFNRPVSRFWFLFLFLYMFSPLLSFVQFLTPIWVVWNIRCSKSCLLLTVVELQRNDLLNTLTGSVDPSVADSHLEEMLDNTKIYGLGRL